MTESGFFRLTSNRAFVRFEDVFILRIKYQHQLRRIISAAVMLLVFFLPLHFHPAAATAQVAKECSCVHGTRTEAGLAPAPANWIPVLAWQPVVGSFLDWSGYVLFYSHGIRAPPFTASL